MTQILPETFTATPGFRFPVFLTSSIDQKLGIYKNLLKEKGIDNISDEGHLIFERKNGIAITPSSGITSGKLKPGFILYEPHHSLRTRIPNIIRPSSLLTNLYFSRIRTHHTLSARIHSDVLQQDAAIWVADKITLKKDLEVTFTNNSKQLIIITNELIVEDGVTFTWENAKQLNTPSARSRPAQKDASSTPGNDGSRGKDGLAGEDGLNGLDAPSLEVWALKCNQLPKIELDGQQGQHAAKGQDGGKGQNGSRGKSGELVKVMGLSPACSKFSGSGGDGGDGGKGGKGGKGGDGGNGGSVTIYSLQDSINKLHSNFKISTDAGAAGNGGNGGLAGQGGKGGNVGFAPSSSLPVLGTVANCAGTQVRAGHYGSAGGQGHPGDPGVAGEDSGNGDSFQVITRKQFVKELTKPMIINVDKEVIDSGDSFTLTVKNM